MEKLLLRMLASALWRNTGFCSLQDFQKCLLYAFTGNITGNGYIFCFFCDFINLIEINNTMLSTLNIIIRCLNDFEKNVFNIFSDISCFRQCRCICNCKRNIQNFSKRLCQICLTGAGRTYHQNITLLQFNVHIGAIHNSLIVIVNCYRKCFFCILLSNYIFIQKGFDFFWF